jgi:hypothetical protein
LISIGGLITCQNANGNLTVTTHPYFSRIVDMPSGSSALSDRMHADYDPESKTNDANTTALTDRFCQALALLKLELGMTVNHILGIKTSNHSYVAWETALMIDRRPIWLALSHKAMEQLNVDLAIRVYRQLGDAGMVMALCDFIHIEDKNLVAGNQLNNVSELD